jgi:hypothetical protein
MIMASTSAPILAAAISATAGLLGVIAGSRATTLRDRQARREAAERALDVAALRCLARAKKIEMATNPKKEIYLLGADLDNYVAAIAAVEDHATRARHWKIYEQAGSILIGQQTENVAALVEALEKIRDELMETARAG